MSGSDPPKDSTKDPQDERRQFPRVKAPIYCRPAARRLPRRQVVDVGLGGMRVYSDEDFAVGARFEIELFFPDTSSITCLAEVVWTRKLPNDTPAPFDVGLQFLDVPASGRQRLSEILDAESESG